MRHVTRDVYTIHSAWQWRHGYNLKKFVAVQRIPPGRLSLFMKFYVGCGGRIVRGRETEKEKGKNIGREEKREKQRGEERGMGKGKRVRRQELQAEKEKGKKNARNVTRQTLSVAWSGR